jgi:hypothetical protein
LVSRSHAGRGAGQLLEQVDRGFASIVPSDFTH